MARSFTWKTASNGCPHIHLSLPPEIAEAFLNSVEQSLAQLEDSTCNALTDDASTYSTSQRRADAAMSRAIKTRDQHCQYPGCNVTRHLQIHYIQHWADGGSTSIENGVCLCSRHHTIVHEGGYRIEQVANHAERIDEQFIRQQAQHKYVFVFDIERDLRNNRESFDYIRKLSPTRFRFRVMDRDGRDVRDVEWHDSTRVEKTISTEQSQHQSAHPNWSEIAECVGSYRVFVNQIQLARSQHNHHGWKKHSIFALIDTEQQPHATPQNRVLNER